MTGKRYSELRTQWEYSELCVWWEQKCASLVCGNRCFVAKGKPISMYCQWIKQGHFLIRLKACCHWSCSTFVPFRKASKWLFSPDSSSTNQLGVGWISYLLHCVIAKDSDLLQQLWTMWMLQKQRTCLCQKCTFCWESFVSGHLSALVQKIHYGTPG